MGSPYYVHSHIAKVHIVRSPRGFFRILEVVARSMSTSVSSYEDGSPEWVVFNDLYSAYNLAATSRSRTAVFLEARYEWRGWKEFQRSIVIDLSGNKEVPSNKGIFLRHCRDVRSLLEDMGPLPTSKGAL